MPRETGSTLDPPESVLGAGEPERRRGGAELVGFLPVDDAGLGVCEKRGC